MNDFIPRRQTVFSPASVQLHEAAKPEVQQDETAKNKDLQDGAAPVQVHADSPLPDSDFTLSVDEVRQRLREQEIEKSKDTIQRYCRNGELACRKLGMFKRFYATENSVTKLIDNLQPDASAVQVHASAQTEDEAPVQVHEAAPEDDPEEKTTDTNDMHEAASSGTHLHEGADQDGAAPVQVHAGAHDKTIEVLQAQLEEKDRQLERKDTQIDALMQSLSKSHDLTGGLQAVFGRTVRSLGGTVGVNHDEPNEGDDRGTQPTPQNNN